MVYGARCRTGGTMIDLDLYSGPTRTVSFSLPADLAARMSGHGRHRSDRFRRLCAAYVLEAEEGRDRFLRQAEALARAREPDSADMVRVSVKLHEGLCARIESLIARPAVPLSSMVRAMAMLAWTYMGEEMWP